MLKKILVAGLLAAPALASAQGAYLVLGAATGSVDLGDIEATYAPPRTSDDDMQRALVGIGLPFHPNLAFEALYMTSVENRVDAAVGSDELEHGGIQAALVVKAPLTPQFSVFGRLSANLIASSYHYQDFPLTSSYDNDESGAYLGFGAGAEFQVSDQVGIRFQVESIQLRDITIVGLTGEEDADFDVDQTSLALTFSF